MKKVLLIDDDKDYNTVVKYVLNEYGFEVSHHYSGMDVPETIQKYQPDLLLLDIRLPGKSGFEICKEIRQKSDIPIILFSAWKKGYEKEITNCKANGFVEKPFDIRELVGTIGLNML